jgi:hypothetical protein
LVLCGGPVAALATRTPAIAPPKLAEKLPVPLLKQKPTNSVINNFIFLNNRWLDNFLYLTYILKKGGFLGLFRLRVAFWLDRQSTELRRHFLAPATLTSSGPLKRPQ